ncbi:hypothetical protein ACYJW8_02825 [Frateuria aurantia]
MPKHRFTRPFRPGIALAAGAIAITVNSALLNGADCLGLPTAHGGLLQLLLRWLDGRPSPPVNPLTALGFHGLVGLGMALFYAAWLEPRRSAPAWQCGLYYAAVVWLLNAGAVLPLLGQGLAGSRVLRPAGIAAFAVAHTVFFVLLAVLYARWCSSAPTRPDDAGSVPAP